MGSILCLMEGENGDVFLERVCFGVLMHGLCGGIEGLLNWRVVCCGM